MEKNLSFFLGVFSTRDSFLLLERFPEVLGYWAFLQSAGRKKVTLVRFDTTPAMEVFVPLLMRRRPHPSLAHCRSRKIFSTRIFRRTPKLLEVRAVSVVFFSFRLSDVGTDASMTFAALAMNLADRAIWYLGLFSPLFAISPVPQKKVSPFFRV